MFSFIRLLRRHRGVRGPAVLLVLVVILSACSSGPASPPGSSTTDVGATLAKAVHEMRHGDKASAVVDFLAVVRTDRHNYVAWYDLGVIAVETGQATEAANDYLAALSSNPKYVPALYNLAILETAKQPKTAVELYQKAIDVQPNNADAHLNLGFVLETLGQRLAGQLQIARAVQLDPSLDPRVPSSAMTPG